MFSEVVRVVFKERKVKRLNWKFSFTMTDVHFASQHCVNDLSSPSRRVLCVVYVDASTSRLSTRKVEFMILPLTRAYIKCQYNEVLCNSQFHTNFQPVD